jgi:HEAT repeat protein
MRILAALLLSAVVAAAQERGPTATTAAELKAAIDSLGAVDYDTRMKAGRTVRRSPPALAIPALMQAVREHADGYIRFKALVLLTGFPDPRTPDLMEEAMASPNDRLREVAYGYFEAHPAPAMIPRLLAALEKEQGDFARPLLVRALAAQASDPRARDALIRDAGRGLDYFRSTVIEAIGDYKVTAAIPTLVNIVKLEGPLQDDAALALGKMGDKSVVGTLAALQRTAPRESQPAIAAAICLTGTNCSSHVGYLQKTLAFGEDYPGYQELLRGAASGLGAIGAGGNEEAVTILFDVGVPSQDPLRAPVTLALGLVSLRNTPLMLRVLEKRQDQAASISLLAEAFDMLEEALEEEQFFVFVRKTYWDAPDGSPMRRLCEQLITKLDF